MVYQGKIARFCALPDDLPPEAVQEREQCLRAGLKAQVMIPLKVMDVVVGAIAFGSLHGHRDWPDDLIERLRLVGEIFSNALARKRADEALGANELSLRRSQEELQQLAARLIHAQEEERRHIAREMHDDWSQRLAILGIDAAKLEKHLGTPKKAQPLLQSIREQLVRLSEEVHDLSRQLHPSILDDLGLVEALRSECVAFARREKIVVDYRPGKIPADVPQEIALCVYRVAQEALRNLAKHAAVGKAWVALDTADAALLLRVEDKGTGFDLETVRSQPGLGVSSMVERVRFVRGILSLTSTPGRGTIVEVRVPLTGSDG